MAVSILIVPLTGIFLICGIFLFSPVARPSQQWFKTGRVSEIRNSEHPISMVVYQEHWDAWTRYPDIPICSIFVREKASTKEFVALPGWHAGRMGISLNYDKNAMKFVSACWCEEFDLDGKKIDNSECPHSEEALPRLALAKRDGQIWVRLPGDIY